MVTRSRICESPINAIVPHSKTDGHVDSNSWDFGTILQTLVGFVRINFQSLQLLTTLSNIFFVTLKENKISGP